METKMDKLVLKRKGVYIVGSIKNLKFKKIKEFKKLNEVRMFYSLISLKNYLKKKELEIAEPEMLKKLDADLIYIIDEEFGEELPMERTPFELKEEEKWWKKCNKLCLTCENLCKQSTKVEILVCPLYKKG
jgi:hypothetical protein